VTRPAVCVREATLEDVDALLELWAELRDIGGRMERLIPGPDEVGMRERLAAVSADPAARALVAVVDGVVAGMMLLTSAAYAPLFDSRAVHAHYLHVKDGYRHRGVGKALLGAAVTFADEVGAEHIMTSVLPQMRETQRFYARLGFGPVVVRRSAAVSVLRRRLMPSAPTVTDNLLARRRSMRRVRAAVARVGD
jgi:ribosomal protein S18 acetylase RimI-like enzyme